MNLNSYLDELSKFNFNAKTFDYCTFAELNIGDFVRSQTMTNSQKYFNKPGFEQYNMTKYGMILEKDLNNPQNSIILCYNNEDNTFYRTNLYTDPGTSGGFYLCKYIG
jgi:hypothetical protein